jgi:hypothetical protein
MECTMKFSRSILLLLVTLLFAPGAPLYADYVVIGGHGDHNIDRPFCGT